MRSTIEDISRNVAGLTVQNLGPGQSQVSVRGVSAGQIVRDQPGVKEQVGVYLDESVDLAFAVHARPRPVRPQPRRDAARPAGHPVRLGLGRRHHPLHHQPAEARHDRGPGRSQCQHRRRGRHRLSPQGRDQHPARRHGGRPRRWLTAPSTRGFIDAVGPAAARTSTTAAASAAALSMLLEPSANAQDHAARRLPEDRAPTASTARSIYNLFDNQFTTTGGDLDRQAQAVSAAAREVQGRHPPRRPDRQRRLRRRRADVRHQLHQPRHPGQPRRFGAHAVGVRLVAGAAPPAIGGATLPSNLARHDQARRLGRRNFAWPRPAAGRSSGCSAASIPTSTVTMRNGCRRRARCLRPSVPERRRSRAGMIVRDRPDRHPSLQRFPGRFAVQRGPSLRHQAEGACSAKPATTSASSS